MTAEDAKELYAALLGNVKVGDDAAGRELATMAAEDLERIKPIVEGIQMRAFQDGCRIGARERKGGDEQESECPCLERGENGMTRHTEPSGRAFSAGLGLVHPCKNHVGNYERAFGYREFAVNPRGVRESQSSRQGDRGDSRTPRRQS